MAQNQQTQWKLVWAEEFDYSGLPDPAKWSYEEGFVRNKEVQYYTRDRLENARVEDGKLVMEVRKDNIANPKYDPKGKGAATQPTVPFSSASIHTHGKAGWLYGRLEVRAKLPQGKGIWPAAWMLGDNIKQVGWPRCGEIDIMEFVGHTPDEVHGTLHWGKNGSKEEKKSSGKAHKTSRPFDDFHVYAVEWFEDRIDFYFDDTKIHTVLAEDVIKTSGENPFSKPHYLILNLALGGAWGREVDESILPQKYYVDYVRVYQQEPATTAKP